MLYWFAPRGGIEPFLPGRFPLFICEGPDGLQPYGFPATGGAEEGVKISFFRQGGLCTPETIDRTVYPEEIAFVQQYLTDLLIPTLDGPCLETATCMYTTTPDEHFIISTHPHHTQVTIAAGFSGHGYKFCSVVGEVLTDLATMGSTSHPIELFAPERFAVPHKD